jgi:hypothetical protein
MNAHNIVNRLLEVGPDELRPKDYLQHINLLYEYHVTVDLPTPEEGYTAVVIVPLAPPAGTEPDDEIDETIWVEQFFNAIDALNRPDLVPKDDVSYVISIQYIGPKNV